MKIDFVLRQAALIGSTIAALGMVACASSRYERSMGEFIDDKALANRVRGALNDQPVYKYPDVKVHAYRGVVQLSGFVAAPAQRDAATEIAERVRGVGEIENDILIAPLERDLARDFIPGREEGTEVRASTTNGVNGAVGRPGSGTNSVTGADRNQER